jgi:TusA-related sulfurtransferase
MDLSTVKADKIIDARTMPCPQPIYETQNAMSTLPKNSILEIRVADRDTKTDLRLWCAEIEQEFLGYLERDGYDSVYIRKIK